MKITIVDGANTGKSMSTTAWLNSRPLENPKTIDEKMVRRLDLPVNEFDSVFLFVECTILEREFFTGLRNHVIWAQGSRVNDVLLFDYPDWVEDKNFMEVCRASMKIAQANGERQDDYRNDLPIFANTKFNTRMSARNLAKMRSYVLKLIDLGEHFHLNDMFLDFATEINIVLFQMGYALEEVNGYKACDPFPVVRKNYEDNSEYAGTVVADSVVIRAEVSFNLMCQLVRHRNLLIRTDLLEQMKSKTVFNMTLNSKVLVEITGLREHVAEVYSKRSCWIAQYNLWSGLLNCIDGLLDLKESGLPCHDGKCPFSKDAQLRVEGKDPNAPCPMLAKLNGEQFSQQATEKATRQLLADERPTFWIDVLKEVQ